jgi:mono/diheme cytochrome c family protein
VATAFVLVVAFYVVVYTFDPMRTTSLTLTVPVVGEMSPVNAAATAVPTVQLSFVVTNTSTTPASDPAPSAETLALGQKLFSSDCSACHGANAQGQPNLGPSLIASPIIQQQTEAEALAFIRKGRPADDPNNKTGIAMPPSGAHPELTDQDILAIIAFLRNH